MIKKLTGCFGRIPIRYKLLLTFLFLLLVIAVGITFSLHFYNQRFIRNMILEKNQQMMRDMNAELNSIYDKIDQVYITISNQDLYQIFLKPDEETVTDFQVIQKELKYKNTVRDLINANNLQRYVDGTLLFANESLWTYVGTGSVNREFDIASAGWYEQFGTSSTGRLIYGPLVEDFKAVNTRKNEVFYFMRRWHIPQSSGISAGEKPFILFSINIQVFVDIFRQFSGETKTVLAMDADGNVLFSVNMKEEAGQEILALIQAHRTELNRQGAWFDRQWAVTGMTNQKFGWEIYSAESTRDTFRDMNRLIRNIYLIILCAGAAAILLALYLTRKIIMPLADLNRMMDQIEEKDVYLDVKSQDELGQIGERFNRMKRRMQEMTERMYLSLMQEKEAQISALQAQINPHFLYNTLDNIYCIAQLEGSEDIIRLTENLSNMMRYSISMKHHHVPLVRELEHVKSYVDILNVRFDDSITLKIQVDENARNIEIPKLSMQPLAENAWNHGILPKAGHHGVIRFQVSAEGDDCIVRVEDDGVGITEEKAAEINRALEKVCYDTTVSDSGSGIAIRNVNNRIMLEDGDGYGVRLYRREEGGCLVVVRMKARRKM